MGNRFQKQSLGSRADALEHDYLVFGSAPSSPRPLRLRRRANSIAAPRVTEPLPPIVWPAEAYEDAADPVHIPQHGSVFFYEDDGDESVLVEMGRGAQTNFFGLVRPMPNVYRPGAFWDDERGYVDPYPGNNYEYAHTHPFVLM